MYLGNIFSLFLINFLFLKILAFLVQKTEILAKKCVFFFFFFVAFLVKIFKNKKLIKKVRKHSLETLSKEKMIWDLKFVNFTLPKALCIKGSLNISLYAKNQPQIQKMCSTPL